MELVFADGFTGLGELQPGGICIMPSMWFSRRNRPWGRSWAARDYFFTWLIERDQSRSLESQAEDGSTHLQHKHISKEKDDFQAQAVDLARHHRYAGRFGALLLEAAAGASAGGVGAGFR